MTEVLFVRLDEINAIVASAVSGIGAMVGSNNLSELTNKGTARTNLGVAIGSDVQAFTASLNSWAALTRASGFDTFATTPTSANLKALLTDETGSGAAVFANTPTFVTPVLGDATASSISLPILKSAAAIQFQNNGTTFAGNINTSQQWSIGQNTTPVTGVRMTISDNISPLLAMSGFVPTLLIGGADTTRGVVAIQTFATGNESSFLGFSTQGTAASPLSTVSGQFLVEFFGHGYTSLGGSPGWQHNTGGGMIVTATENYTASAQGSSVVVYTTQNGTVSVNPAATFGNDGSFSTANSITVGSPSPASGTVRGLGLNGAAAGSGAGTSITGNDGGSIVWSVGSYSALFGGAYDGRMTLFSGSLGVVTNSSFKSLSPTGGIGYGTGAGGAITQTGSRTTGVTLNTISGAITLFSAAGTNSLTTFTVTDSAVAATDTVLVHQKSGTDKYWAWISRVAAGAFDITFNDQTSTTVEQPVFTFNIIKGVTS